MNRIHIHLGVDDLAQGVAFYSALFGAEPTKHHVDYAKWMLDDPQVNFAISTRSGKKGLDHLGLQVDSDDELKQIRDRIQDADIAVLNEGETICCYAESDKSWVQDPAGIAWEAYHTTGDRATFSDQVASAESACCAPAVSDTTGCGNPSASKTGCS